MPFCISVLPWLEYGSYACFSVPPQDHLSFSRIFAQEVSRTNITVLEKCSMPRRRLPVLAGNFARKFADRTEPKSSKTKTSQLLLDRHWLLNVQANLQLEQSQNETLIYIWPNTTNAWKTEAIRIQSPKSRAAQAAYKKGDNTCTPSFFCYFQYNLS